MAVVLVLAITAVVVAAVTLPGRRQQVTAARWRHALHTLRQEDLPARVRTALPDVRQAPEHVRVLRPRGRVARR